MIPYRFSRMHYCRLISLASIVAAISSAGVFPLLAAHADGNNNDGYTGRYANTQFGFEVSLPNGWKAFENPTINATSVHASPYIGTVAQPATFYINVDAFNLHEMDSCIENTHSYTHSTVTIDGMPAVKCVFTFNQLETYFLKSTSHNYMIELDATHYTAYGDKTSFDNYMSQMRSALGTLKIDNAIDPQSSNSTAPLNLFIEKVHLPDKDIQLSFESSSTISAVNFDEQNKKLSFTVSGQDGTTGTTIIHIGSLLQGPYAITFDGKPRTDFKTDAVSDTITLNYHHSSHAITISGGQVVPEFPLPIIIGAVVGLVAIIGRIGLLSRPSN